jgi:hypothetical protein
MMNALDLGGCITDAVLNCLYMRNYCRNNAIQVIQFNLTKYYNITRAVIPFLDNVSTFYELLPKMH